MNRIFITVAIVMLAPVATMCAEPMLAGAAVVNWLLDTNS